MSVSATETWRHSASIPFLVAFLKKLPLTVSAKSVLARKAQHADQEPEIVCSLITIHLDSKGTVFSPQLQLHEITTVLHIIFLPPFIVRQKASHCIIDILQCIVLVKYDLIVQIS